MNEPFSNDRVEVAGLRVERDLFDLVDREVLPGTGIATGYFWRGFADIVHDLGPQNQALLARRDLLQQQLDEWYAQTRGQSTTVEEQRQFLKQIGYLVDEGDDFSVTTENVDPEIASVAAPQLVVPVDNARYALNAANARWGSLFDALYGTDAVPRTGVSSQDAHYDSARGDKVISTAMELLDRFVTLTAGSYRDVTQFALVDSSAGKQLVATLRDNERATLVHPDQFVGYAQTGTALSRILLKHHSLHVILQLDLTNAIGKQHPAGIRDVILEAAVSTIEDFEDSVAAVDAQDKVAAYRNWLGLMKGDLTATFSKRGQEVIRDLAPDLVFVGIDGQPLILPGRSLLLARNVGIHMYTDAVVTAAGEEIPEGFLDAMMTAAAALHDLKGTSRLRNTRSGSIYIVKPKLHGPEEATSTVELLGRVEEILGLPSNTLKLGIMDEERRTTVNLKQCIRMARDRIVFINTGFLDRTGDEIHTAMQAGPQVPKPEIKKSIWLRAYEDSNVEIGLRGSLPGKGQIGKGMWTAPEQMAEMLRTKIDHPQAGASCAWVPSPTAATLHALHYHQVHVAERQTQLRTRPPTSLDAILTTSLLGDRILTAAEIQAELDNNLQGILGYVVHWVDRGIGCSKVPDIHGVELMEDRATLRISSQHVCNWLLHGIIDEHQLRQTFERMAVVVDRQNAGRAGYRTLGPDFYANHAFQAALELVFNGLAAPNGYTEATLAKYRRKAKVLEPPIHPSQDRACVSSPN